MVQSSDEESLGNQNATPHSGLAIVMVKKSLAPRPSCEMPGGERVDYDERYGTLRGVGRC
jgi:hypothetical protein